MAFYLNYNTHFSLLFSLLSFSFSQFDAVEAPSPSVDSCNGIFLSYAYSSGTKLKPTDPTHQPYRFESVLMVINNGDEKLKSWKVSVEFQNDE
ncbi:hypothetical protein ES288_A13G126400v1 [Gossypium darwinii]|uniref:Uncharacterized protein n=2 Tax=Gossypium TaxID=3633 RepID=A0A5D2MK16_GOSTO|nr:hypothetical protein ES288_A13G126400v1 [Gossypium darwinii]TYH91624.1 hypothetical protein ES332_A13G128800v1 [Gossypium tomentosum]